MSFSRKNQEFSLKTSRPLHEVRAILADMANHCERSVLEAAIQLSSEGETEQERERGLALTTLLDAVISDQN